MRPCSSRQRPQDVAKLRDALGIESAHRFVEDVHRRLAQERLRETEPLAHALRPRPNRLLSDPGETDEFEGTGGLVPRASSAIALQSSEHLEIPEAGPRGVRPGGFDQAAEACPSRHRMAHGIESIDQDAPLVRPDEAQGDPHRGGLPGTVVAEESVAVAISNAQCDAIERKLSSVAMADINELEGHVASPSRNWPSPLQERPAGRITSRAPDQGQIFARFESAVRRFGIGSPHENRSHAGVGRVARTFASRIERTSRPEKPFRAPPHRHEEGRFLTNRKSDVRLPLPKEEDAFSFVVYGDRTGGPDEGVEILSEAVRDTNILGPDLVMTVGDLIQGYSTTGPWMKQMREYRTIMNRLEMPWFPVAGNHDVYWRGKGRPPREHEDHYEAHFGPLWYAVRHKSAWFIVLYSDEGDPETNRRSFRDPKAQTMSPAQTAWLQKTLDEDQDGRARVRLPSSSEVAQEGLWR